LCNQERGIGAERRNDKEDTAMSKRPLPIMIAVGLLAGTGLAACGHKGNMVTPAGAPSADASATSIAAEHCPPSSPEYVLNSGSRLNDSLVPVTVGKLVLCLYNGLNATSPLGLLTSKVITDARTVDAWRQRFNSLPTVEPGIYDCPMDDGASILAGFVDSATSSIVVKVGLRGCQWATNGSSNRSTAQATDAAFLTDLQKLVSG
jgi:hypothetical protein